MKKLEEMASKAVATLVDLEIYGWPPVCIGMIYQPERPNGYLKIINDCKVNKITKEYNKL